MRQCAVGPVGVVLAGGASRRMGRDKALLCDRQGVTLLERTVETLHAAGLAEVAVSVGTAERGETLRAAAPALRDVPFMVDALSGQGPLAGLHAALGAYPGRPVLLVACDMPSLDASALRALLAAATGVDVVVPCIGGRDEPLHALYGPACTGPAGRLLAGGKRAMRDLLSAPGLRVRVLDEAWLARQGIPVSVFHNLNTPADLAAAGYA